MLKTMRRAKFQCEKKFIRTSTFTIDWNNKKKHFKPGKRMAESSVADPGCFIPDPGSGSDHCSIPDPDPDPGSGG
jgi:hypothetical protein